MERLVGRRGLLLRANVVALVACALLLGLAPTAGGATQIVDGALDPSVYSSTLAFARQDGTVVVRAPGDPDVVYPNAAEPSVSGQFLAYTDTATNGIRVVRWRTGEEIRYYDGVSKPALAWPLLAYLRESSSYRRLVLRNLRTGTRSIQLSVKARIRVGRPSLRSGKLAWHTASRNGSTIYVRNLKTKRRTTVAKSKITLLMNPSVSRNRVVWVNARSGSTLVMAGWTHKKARRAIHRMRSRGVSWWTTALTDGAAYMTRWRHSSGDADLYRRRL